MSGAGDPMGRLRSSSGYWAFEIRSKVSGSALSCSKSFCDKDGTTGCSSPASRYTTSAASERSRRASSGSFFTCAHGAWVWRKALAALAISPITFIAARYSTRSKAERTSATRESASSTSFRPGPSPPAARPFCSGPASMESDRLARLPTLLTSSALTRWRNSVSERSRSSGPAPRLIA